MKLPESIQAALKRFQTFQGPKKGFLFCQGQGFHFYNREVCSLAYARLSLHWRQLHVEYQVGDGQIEPLLLLVLKDQLQVVTQEETWVYETGKAEEEILRLGLSYGVLYDPARQTYLRGFVYLQAKVSPKLYESYFVEDSIRNLLELFMFPQTAADETFSCVKNQGIGALVQQMNEQSMEAVAKTYLRGIQAAAFLKKDTSCL